VLELQQSVMNIIDSITKHITFRLVEVNDSEFILSLRTNEKKNKFLSAVENDLEAQQNWIIGYKEREKSRQEYYYIIEESSEKLGVVRLYDFKEDSFSWGSWIFKEGSPSYAAIESALVVYEIAFYSLGFNQSHFEVIKANQKVVDFHLRFGATITGEDDIFYYFNISQETYEKTKQKYRKFFAS
jgi:RimJ/RimL family protein N-acetyltransferase